MTKRRQHGARNALGAFLPSLGMALPGAALAQADPAPAAIPDPTMVGGSDTIIMVALGLFVVVLAVLYARQVKRTTLAEHAQKTTRIDAEERIARAAVEVEAAVLEAMAVASWRRDEDGCVVSANQAAQALFPELEKSTVLAERARHVGAPQSESRNMVIGGDRRLLEITETPLSGGGTIGTARDVTVIEQLQADLARHVDAHAEVLEKVNSAIAVFGPDRRLVFANAAFGRLWGIDKDQLERDPTLTEVLELARESRRLPEQSDFRAWRDDFNRLFATLTSDHEEFLFLPDDTTVRMVVTLHPFGGLMMTFDDVTARLSLERSYNTLSAVQQATLDNLYDGVAVFGADGRLKLSNPTFHAQWGLLAFDATKEPHATNVMEAMRPRFPGGGAVDWAETKADWIARLGNRRPRSGRLEQADGQVLDYGMVPLPDGAMLVNFRDVTDTLVVQRALQERTEALEMADRLKSEFLANVSYELRTPLNAIIGFSEILGQEFAGPLNDRQKEYAHAILGSSNRLVRLVNDILDLASIEAGYLELDQTEMDPHELAAAIETLGRERAHSRGISFIVSVAEGLAPILVDERRLTQALYNLVSNAFAFTPDGGKVVVEIEDSDDAMALRVTDTGLGIAVEDQDRVFDRFERTGRAAGPGLGLALVKSLIELHDGTVTLTSEPDQGTEVVCRIPRRTAKSSKAFDTPANLAAIKE